MENILFTCQEHDAIKAGHHFDYRLVKGEVGYSWASKKELPEPGKMVIWFRQPDHTRSYSLSKEVHIPEGQYGAGITKLLYAKKALIHDDATSDKFKFTTSDGKSFLLKKLDNNKYGEDSWLLRNISDSKNLKPNKYIEKISK